jgi:hypothetical protein
MLLVGVWASGRSLLFVTTLEEFWGIFDKSEKSFNCEKDIMANHNLEFCNARTKHLAVCSSPLLM